jgi:hypothetical protein
MLIPVLNYAWLIAVFQEVIGRSNYLHPFCWASLAFMFCPCQYVRPGFWVLFNNLISCKKIIWNLWNNIFNHFTQVGFEFGYCFYYDSRVMPPELTTDKLFACSFRVMALFTLAGKGGCICVLWIHCSIFLLTFLKDYSVLSSARNIQLGHQILHFHCLPNSKEGLSWLWSYGSWIYNYLCNPCLSPLMWVRISITI